MTGLFRVCGSVSSVFPLTSELSEIARRDIQPKKSLECGMARMLVPAVAPLPQLSCSFFPARTIDAFAHLQGEESGRNPWRGPPP